MIRDTIQTGEQKQKTRIMVDMTASLLHYGHIRLLQKAQEMGYVIVALTTDDEIIKHKGYAAELSFDQRREILLALRYVDEVVPSPWLISEDYVRSHNVDILLHGDDNSNIVESVRTLPRTAGISSNEIRERATAALVVQANSKKTLFTPGPTNLHPENIAGIRPVFTRGDDEFTALQSEVLERVRERAGQEQIACMQGSATTAIEVATTNFLQGKVLVILSGYYSDRILHMLDRKKHLLNLNEVNGIKYDDFKREHESLSQYDWIVAVTTETADALLTDVRTIKRTADRMKARLMLDATGSINLEDHHELADACMFSSCKGLGGLTGAGFITFNKDLLDNINPAPKEFILDLSTYIDKKTTAAAHALCSLHQISHRFKELGERVKESKSIFIEQHRAKLFRTDEQPALCTKIKAKSVKLPPGSVAYSPRTAEPGTHVICHLFDQFPSNRKVGEIYANVEID